MKIREAMRPGAFTIQTDDTLGAAFQLMTRAQIRHLPVMKDGRVVGMLSERDVLSVRAKLDATESWSTMAVRRAMSAPVQTAHPDDSLTEVAARLAMDRIGALPIVDRGKLLGIATVTDVLNAEVRVAMAPAALSTETAASTMTPFPLTIAPDALLIDGVDMMLQRHIRHLPVVDAHGTIVGMLSDRDVRTLVGDPANFAVSLGTSLTQPRVRDAMTKPAIVVPFDLPITDVVRWFSEENISALPVVDKFGSLLGIISYVDALRVLVRPR